MKKFDEFNESNNAMSEENINSRKEKREAIFQTLVESGVDETRAISFASYLTRVQSLDIVKNCEDLCSALQNVIEKIK